MKRYLVLLPLLPVILISCANLSYRSSLSNLSYRSSLYKSPEAVRSMVSTTAISPSSDSIMAQQMAIALIKRGITVVDRGQMVSLLDELGMTEAQLLEPGSISKLRAKGILAYMDAKAVVGEDGRPELVYVSIASTLEGKFVSGAVWASGDTRFGVDLHSVAAKIATQIVENMFVQPREDYYFGPMPTSGTF
jgi:hypothetical protein